MYFNRYISVKSPQHLQRSLKLIHHPHLGLGLHTRPNKKEEERKLERVEYLVIPFLEGTHVLIKKNGTKIQSVQCITFDSYQPSRRFWYEK